MPVIARRQKCISGPLLDRQEDIQTVVMPLDEAMEMIASGEIQDAKTIVALQYLVLRKFE